MKTLYALTSTILLCVAALASDVTIAIVDKSPADSPLQNSGTVILSTSATSNGKTMMWYRDDWTVKNVSPKAVMTFVEVLQVQYSNGQRVERIQQHEAFFHSQLINSGEDLSVSTGHPSGKMLVTGEAQLNALEASPSAGVTVRWVQFADGTTFGDEKFASEILDVRKATYTTLAHLNHVYQTEGPARFLQELQSGTGSGDVDAYLGHLLRVQKEKGTEAAYRQLRFHLKMAEDRRQFIR